MKKTSHSLTPQEYEQIYYFLNEYSRLIKLNKIEEPFYIKDVRLCNLEHAQSIMKKMKYVMEKKYPNKYAY